VAKADRIPLSDKAKSRLSRTSRHSLHNQRMHQRQRNVADAVIAQMVVTRRRARGLQYRPASETSNNFKADKAAALDSARSIEVAINDLISYLSCPKSHVNTGIQVRDVLPFVMM
jgi:hypothetical protein